MILALLFWNQIFICDSLRLSSWARDCLRCSVMYRFAWNSALSLCSCSAVKAVLGRLSSFSLFFFFNFRVLGPSVETTIKRRHKYHKAAYDTTYPHLTENALAGEWNYWCSVNIGAYLTLPYWKSYFSCTLFRNVDNEFIPQFIIRQRVLWVFVNYVKRMTLAGMCMCNCQEGQETKCCLHNSYKPQIAANFKMHSKMHKIFNHKQSICRPAK